MQTKSVKSLSTVPSLKESALTATAPIEKVSQEYLIWGHHTGLHPPMHTWHSMPPDLQVVIEEWCRHYNM